MGGERVGWEGFSGAAGRCCVGRRFTVGRGELLHLSASPEAASRRCPRGERSPPPQSGTFYLTERNWHRSSSTHGKTASPHPIHLPEPGRVAQSACSHRDDPCPSAQTSWSRRNIRARVIAALAMSARRCLRRALSDELSGGERQRVAIARALIADPALSSAMRSYRPHGQWREHT